MWDDLLLQPNANFDFHENFSGFWQSQIRKIMTMSMEYGSTVRSQYLAVIFIQITHKKHP